MALVGNSFTVRGTSYTPKYEQVFEGEAYTHHSKTQYIKDMFAMVRQALEAGADGIQITRWNNWVDGYGSINYQSCSVAYVDRGIDGKRSTLRYRRSNIF